MRIRTMILSLAAAAMTTGVALADEKPRDGERGRRPSPEMRKKLLEKFDADGDGKLNEAERSKARAEMKKRRGDRKPGEGRPGPRGPRSPEFRKKMLEKFDADGDGKLNEEERAKARKEAQGKRGPRGEKSKEEA